MKRDTCARCGDNRESIPKVRERTGHTRCENLPVCNRRMTKVQALQKMNKQLLAALKLATDAVREYHERYHCDGDVDVPSIIDKAIKNAESGE